MPSGPNASAWISGAVEDERGDRAGGVRRRVGRGAVQHTEARPRGAVPGGAPARDVAPQPARAAGSYSRIMVRMTNAPDWITVASYENAGGRPTPLAAVRA
ncbi:UNVERIFIED_CONTAM: hypothetical protein RKD50_006493 [Streptomyces canus]